MAYHAILAPSDTAAAGDPAYSSYHQSSSSPTFKFEPRYAEFDDALDARFRCRCLTPRSFLLLDLSYSLPNFPNFILVLILPNFTFFSQVPEVCT